MALHGIAPHFTPFNQGRRELRTLLWVRSKELLRVQDVRGVGWDLKRRVDHKVSKEGVCELFHGRLARAR